MAGLNADDIQFARDRQMSIYVSLVGLVLLIYDHLLTFETEVKYIWVREHRRASAWFLFIRYFAFFSNIFVAVTLFGNFSSEHRNLAQTCDRLNVVLGLLIVVIELAVGCTLILRVYAMYSFNKRILICLVIAALITVCVGAWSTVPAGTNPTFRSTLPGCQTAKSETQHIRMAAAWEAELACEVVILGLTVYRVFKQTRDTITSPGSLWRVMIRDGVMYFAIICLANLANILAFYLGDPITASSLSWITAAISVVMITRLMLNLHTAAAPDTESTVSRHLGTLRFAQSVSAVPEESVF